MKRLAMILLSGALGGCIYLTPPTGLRIGDHANEFPQPAAQNQGTSLRLLEYVAPDFRLIFPEIWSVGAKIDEVSADGKVTRRVGIGAAGPNGESEGLLVTTVNIQPTLDAAADRKALEAFVLGALKGGFNDDVVVVDDSEKTLGGLPGHRLEIQGTERATAEKPTNFPIHTVAYSTIHQNKGYIVVITTLETRYAPLKALFEGLFERFSFTSGVPGEAGATAPREGGATAPVASPQAP